MRTAKITSIVLGSIPIVGWLISLPYNWWALGDPFTATGEWNYLPLWIVTMPLIYIAEIFSNRNWFAEYPYLYVLIYTVICAVIYAVIGAAIPICLQYIINKLKKS